MNFQSAVTEKVVVEIYAVIKKTNLCENRERHLAVPAPSLAAAASRCRLALPGLVPTLRKLADEANAIKHKHAPVLPGQALNGSHLFVLECCMDVDQLAGQGWVFWSA